MRASGRPSLQGWGGALHGGLDLRERSAVILDAVPPPPGGTVSTPAGEARFGGPGVLLVR